MHRWRSCALPDRYGGCPGAECRGAEAVETQHVASLLSLYSCYTHVNKCWDRKWASIQHFHAFSLFSKCKQAVR
jgi:hypothetical protein